MPNDPKDPKDAPFRDRIENQAGNRLAPSLMFVIVSPRVTAENERHGCRRLLRLAP